MIKIGIENKDVDQKKIFLLALGFFVSLAISFWGIARLSNGLFKKQSELQKFSNSRYEPKPEEMDDFESGKPAQALKNLQLKHIQKIDTTLEALSRKSLTEIDDVFKTSRRKRRSK